MKNSTPIKVVFAVVLIAAALFVFIKSGSETVGIEQYEGQSVYLKCTKCAFVKEMEKDGYFKMLRDEFNNEERPLECEDCGGDCYRALKCSKCNNVFIRGLTNTKYPDRCPKCGFSESQVGAQ